MGTMKSWMPQASWPTTSWAKAMVWVAVCPAPPCQILVAVKVGVEKKEDGETGLKLEAMPDKPVKPKKEPVPRKKAAAKKAPAKKTAAKAKAKPAAKDNKPPKSPPSKGGTTVPKVPLKS